MRNLKYYKFHVYVTLLCVSFGGALLQEEPRAAAAARAGPGAAKPQKDFIPKGAIVPLSKLEPPKVPGLPGSNATGGPGPGPSQKANVSTHMQDKSRASARKRREAARSANGHMQVLIWGFLAGFVSLLSVCALYILFFHEREQPLLKERRAARPRSVLRSEQSERSLRCSSQVDDATSMSEAPSSQQDSAAGSGSTAELCPLLIVPAGTRLACVVQSACQRKKQELTFNIRGLPSSGGVPLFQVRVSEFCSEVPGIYVETLRKQKSLASLCTERVYDRPSGRAPELLICGPQGPHSVLQKTPAGDYRITCHSTGLLLLTYSGDFRRHHVSVVSASGETIARVSQPLAEEYHVYVQSRADAGIVILGLLGIDKCEQDPDAGSASDILSAGGSSGERSKFSEEYYGGRAY